MVVAMVGYTNDGMDRTSERPEGACPTRFFSIGQHQNLNFVPKNLKNQNSHITYMFFFLIEL